MNVKAIEVHVATIVTSRPPASNARTDLLATMPGFGCFQCLSLPLEVRPEAFEAAHMRTLFQVAELIEQKQRVIAHAAEVPIVG